MTTSAGKKNMGVLYGLIHGGIAILFTLVLYLGGVKWFTHPLAWSALAIPLVVGVLGGLAQKKVNGGFLSFGEALKTVFTVFVIGTLVSTAFSYLLFNVIDVPFREALSQEAAEATAKMMERFGASQEQIDKAVEETLSGNNYTLSRQVLGFAFMSIVWFVISLIIAAIIKKDKPAF
jgi:hypothetical protein